MKVIMLTAALVLGGCATHEARVAEPRNAATSSAVATGQPRAMESDVDTTRITSAEIRAETPPKPAPVPKSQQAPPQQPQGAGW